MALGKELTVWFCVMLAVTIALGGFAVMDQGDFQRVLAVDVKASAQRADWIGQLTTTLAEMKGNRQLLIAGSPGGASNTGSAQAREQGSLKVSAARLDRVLTNLEPLLTEQSRRQLFEAFRGAHESWAGNHADFTRRCADCHVSGGISTDGDAKPHGALERAVYDLAQMQRDSLAAASGQVGARAARGRLIAVGLVGLCLLIGAQVLRAVRRSSRSLRKTTAMLSQGSTQAAAAAREIAEASAALASSADQQSRSVEATSSTTEQLARMTLRNTEHTSESVALVSRVEASVQAANTTLRSFQVSMDEINAASARISGIIKIIDGIAFQTNILALNAAVEAARAGESGMGFAIVAEEVRTLAHRSAEAARDTASLIEESNARSNEGRAKLEEVIHSIQDITRQTGQVKSLIDSVSAGSREQSAGIEGIARVVGEMATHVHELTGSAGRLASVAETIASQTGSVETSVSRLHTLVDGSA